MLDITKTCTKCQKELPLDQFNSNGRSIRGDCKACVKAYRKRYWGINGERVRAEQVSKRRAAGIGPRTKMGDEERRRRKSEKDKRYRSRPGYSEKFNAYHKEWREKNWERWRAMSQKSRSKGLPGRYPGEEEIKRLFDLADGLCVYCGDDARDLDHFIARASDGCIHDPTNLVPACRSCNSSKRNSDPWEWVESKGRDRDRVEQFLAKLVDEFGPYDLAIEPKPGPSSLVEL